MEALLGLISKKTLKRVLMFVLVQAVIFFLLPIRISRVDNTVAQAAPEVFVIEVAQTAQAAANDDVFVIQIAR